MSEEETVVLPSGAIGVVRPEYLTHKEEIRALKAFAKKVEQMSPNGRRAAIFWLADFYLGIKLWGRW
jgi:hypothetical protein